MKVGSGELTPSVAVQLNLQLNLSLNAATNRQLIGTARAPSPQVVASPCPTDVDAVQLNLDPPSWLVWAGGSMGRVSTLSRQLDVGPGLRED